MYICSGNCLCDLVKKIIILVKLSTYTYTKICSKQPTQPNTEKEKKITTCK